MVEIGLFLAFVVVGAILCLSVYSKMDADWGTRVRVGVFGLIAALGSVSLNATVCLYYLIARPPLKTTILGGDFNFASAILLIVSAIVAAFSLLMIFQGVRTTVLRSRNAGKMLDAFIQNTPAAVSLKNTDRVYTMVNNKFTEWFCPDGVDPISQRSSNFADAEHVKLITEIEDTVLETGQPVIREVRVPTVNKRVRTVLLHKFPLIDAAGTIIGIGGIETDISRQIDAERKLEATLERLNDAMRITKLGFWEWDEVNDQSISLAPNFLEMMGIDISQPDSIVFSAEDMFQYLHPDDVEAYKIASNVRLSIHDGFIATYRVQTPTGEVRHLQEIGQAVRSENGTLVRSYGTIQDITEPVELTASLRQAREEAVAADRAKTEFLAHMSHELRSPLNSILGFSEIIESNTSNIEEWERHTEYAGYIKQSGQHLLGIIDDILDLAKIEHGSFDIRLSSVEIESSIHESIKIVESSRPDGTATFTVDADPDASHLIADQRLLRQILINLYSNAAKFTPLSGTIDTKVTSVSDGESMMIEISDTGCGIDAKDIPLVLSPFGQARSNINVAHGGAGLGLALTKRMVELHRGTLELRSSLGEGTTVSMIFPVRQPKEKAEAKSA